MNPHSFTISDTYTKHKRNLLLISVAAFILAFLDVKINTISILGSAAEVGDADKANILILVLLVYFLLRLWQHYRVEPGAPFGEVLLYHLTTAQDERLEIIAKKYAKHFGLEHPNYFLYRRLNKLSNMKDRNEIVLPDEKVNFLIRRIFVVLQAYSDDEVKLFSNQESRKIKPFNGKNIWKEISDPLENERRSGVYLKIHIEVSELRLIFWQFLGLLKYLFIDKYFSDFRLPFLFSGISILVMLWRIVC